MDYNIIDSIKLRVNNIISEYKFINKRFILYGIIGLSGMTIDFLVFTVFVKVLTINHLISNVISVSLGITNNFFLNRKYNFKIYDKPLSRFISFYTIGISGLLISTVLIYVFVDILNFPVLSTKLGVILIVVIFQYIGNKNITFK